MTKAELPERIETKRLVLRVRTVADVEDIYAYASLPEVSYPAGFPPVKTLEDCLFDYAQEGYALDNKSRLPRS